MNEELKSILGNEITVDGNTIPVAHLKYKGSEKTYVVWTIINNAPALKANDEDLYSIYSVDIDVYSDSNYLNIEKFIKRLMKSNDFIWSEDSEEMLDDDTELYHKTYTFEKERMIENG